MKNYAPCVEMCPCLQPWKESHFLNPKVVAKYLHVYKSLLIWTYFIAFIEQEKERHRKEQNRKQKQKQSAEELTAETRAAMESIDAMLAKRRVDETPQDEDEAIPWGRVPKQRKLVNENAPSSSSMSQIQQQDSFFSDDMGFRGGDEDDDDDDEIERDMAREAEEARKRVG